MDTKGLEGIIFSPISVLILWGISFSLPLLSIQNVCGIDMSSEMCGERFILSLPSGAVSQNLLANINPQPCQHSWGIEVV